MTEIFHLSSFSGVLQWTLTHGYWLIFVGMLVEGPVVTAASSFAVALGYFNISMIFILALLGDLVADVVYYAIGYWGRITLVERFGGKVGLTKERMERMEKLMKRNAGKTMLALKLTPIIPTPGLMLIGTTRMPLRKFASISLSISLPKTIVFMLVGYYFGRSYDKISRYINNSGYLIVIAVILIFVINHYWGKISARVGKKIEKL